MKNFFLIFKLFFIITILLISIAVISLWNIQSELPDSNISDYFPNEITKIYDTNYDLLYHVGTKDRFYLDYDKIPPEMINAIISAEDKSFFSHQGFDIKGIFRAITINIENLLFKKSSNYVGASTITQQLVKNILLSNEKTLIRKIKEVILSIRIESKYSKQYILELYLNEIYFGRRSYGIAAAASNYFNKSIYDLTLAQYAYLAALPKGPNNYDPNKNYNKALDRRNYVLTQMLLNKYISQVDFDINSASEISVSNYDIKKYRKDYATDYISKKLNSLRGSDNNAYYVQSTISPFIQQLSEKALIDQLSFYEKKYRSWEGSYTLPLKSVNEEYLKHWDQAKVLENNGKNITIEINKKKEILKIEINLYGPKKISPINFLNKGDYFFVSLRDNNYYLMQPPIINGSIIVMNPYNGNILSLVGGTSYNESNFNRATQAYRQPGSSIKPFIYASALSEGKFVPNSLILDSQISLYQGPKLPIWEPKNYSNKSYGNISFRKSLETSNNLVTLKIGLDLGINKINNFFNDISLYENNNKEIYSLLLGSVEQNLLNLVKSYSIFVNGGYMIKPKIIKKIVSDKGFNVDNSYFLKCQNCYFDKNARSYRKPTTSNKRKKVLNHLTSFQILNILEGAVKNGTGKSLNKINYPIAGKTGTTNDSKDLWFFGLTPEFVVGVYVGYDEPKKIGYKETGSSVALPIFKDFITNYISSNKVDLNVKFNIPQGLLKKYVDLDDYNVYDSFKENTIEEYFTLEQIKIINKNIIKGIN